VTDGADPERAEQRRWDTALLHVDMDAFYVNVELRRDPSLRGRPVVVGGDGPRGVVAAASYEARAYGVRSAMPSVRARRLCPDALFLAGDHALYSEASGQIMARFAEVTPLVEPLSLDEAFLDVTGAQRRLGPPARIAAELRRRILAEERLPCSVGVASTKFLAKLASEAAKPVPSPQGPRPGRGVWVVPPGRELSFLHPLPVRALWGVGPATLARLERLGVQTVGDLAALPLSTVTAAVGDANGRHLHALAHNIDPRAVEPDRAAKSISHEETFATDRTDRAELHTELLRLADGVARRLRAAGLAGHSVTLKLRYGDFTTLTRSRRASEPLDNGLDIARLARHLLDTVEVSPGVRLIGVGVSALAAPSAHQLRLDLDAPWQAPPAGGAADGDGLGDEDGGDGPPGPRLGHPEAWRDAHDTVDAIRRRFGAAAIGPGGLSGGGQLRVFERGQQAWGPSGANRPDQRRRPAAGAAASEDHPPATQPEHSEVHQPRRDR
jgi:DNA polymerase-4